MSSNTEAPLYMILADKIEGMIRASTFRPGERIPSVRSMSRQQQVSIPTVIQAYLILEDRHLIEARPKSGFFVRPMTSNMLLAHAPMARVPQVKSLSKFPPLMALVHDIVDPKFIPMGGAHPSAELLPGAKLARIMASIARLHEREAVTCDPAPGCAKLRAELSRHSLDWGCYLTPDDFIITNGATEAVFLALSAVTKPGDTVLIESPTHYGLLNVLSQLDLKAVAVPSHPRDGMEIESVTKAVLKNHIKAMVVVPNFSNPLGACMSESCRHGLIDLATRHQITIIEDDVYGDLYFEGKRPHCLKALDKNHQVMLCGSFSKTLAPGYRVGYLAGGRRQDKLIPMKTALNYSSPVLQALTVAEFMKTGGYEHHLRRMRGIFRDQVNLTRDALSRALPREVKITHPKGGYVLWLELPQSINAMELFYEARSQKLSIAPGHLFSPAAEFQNYIRLSCSHPWSPRIEEGITVLGKLVSRMLS